jgi:hypothetical protein
VWIPPPVSRLDGGRGVGTKDRRDAAISISRLKLHMKKAAGEAAYPVCEKNSQMQDLGITTWLS